MVQTLFGYQGGGTANRDYTLYWKFTTADLNWSTVECTGVGVRFADTNHSLKIGITDGTTWLAQGFIELATIDGLNNVTFSSPITLSAGTDYYIGVISDGYFSYYAENSTDSAIYINNEDPEYREEDFDDAFNVAVQAPNTLFVVTPDFQTVAVVVVNVSMLQLHESGSHAFVIEFKLQPSVH